MDLTLRTETFAVDDQSWLASRHGVGEAVSVTLDTSTFTPAIHYPDGFFKSGIALGKITATGLYGPYAGQTNEVQSVTVTGTPTGGTFTLTWSGQTTAAIPYNATSAQVLAALQALSNIGDNDVSVTGGPAPGVAFAVTFKGVLGGTDVAAMTASGAGLTGGSSPTVTIGTTTAGGANPGASDGTESFAGLLFGSIKAPASTSVDVVGAMLDHCKVVNAKLPVPVDAAGRTDAVGRIIFY
jgi:hypothetical protein